MNEAIAKLQPEPLWDYFTKLDAVPRPSKKEEKVREFILNFGASLGLQTSSDEVGNVLIKKPATIGMEARQTVVLQSHLDMVCQKNNDVKFDFDTQGIEMEIVDGFVKAKGTTLGADNGIGVSAIMSILASKNIPHPSLEALFTIDEETGMTGAKGLQPNWLSGTILLNLDTEEDNELTIGCAGGIDVTGNRIYDLQETPEEYITYELKISGLMGGHSGIDIAKGRANANKLLGRILAQMEDHILVNSLEGGSLRNAIPRESKATISCYPEAIETIWASLREDILSEYHTIEKSISITLEKRDRVKTCMNKEISAKVIRTINGLQNGVYRWSPEISDLVEASNNVARIEANDKKITIWCLTRSSVESTKHELVSALQSVLELGEFTVTLDGDYPGWKPNPQSQILELMEKVYAKLFGEPVHISAVHAGLECGIIGSHYPHMQMISFGPNIYGAHSPDERVQISSVDKFWKYLLATLNDIPEL